MILFIKYRPLVFVILLLLLGYNTYSQKEVLKEASTSDLKKNYIGLHLGAQMSGIRKEDYILKKQTPYVQIAVGRKFLSFFHAELFYQDASFKYISDTYTHKYLFVGSNGLINIIPLIFKDSFEDFNCNIIIGAGYFENYFYDRS